MPSIASGRPTIPLETLTTRPQPRSSMSGTTARARLIGANTLIANADCSSPGSVLSIGPTGQTTAALLIRMSTPPSSPTTAAIACGTWSASPRSAGAAFATRPRARTSSAVSSSSSCERASNETFAPAWASATAVARPMPLPAPVTSACAPSNAVTRLPSEERSASVGARAARRRGRLGEHDSLELNANPAGRADRVDARVRVARVDENLLVLFVPGIERRPVDAHHARERLDLLAGKQMRTALPLAPADAKAVARCAPPPQAFGMILVDEQLGVDVVERDVVVRVLRPLPDIERPRRVKDGDPFQDAAYPARHRLDVVDRNDALRVVAHATARFCFRLHQTATRPPSTGMTAPFR